MNRGRFVIIVVPFVLLFIFALSYFPHKIVNIDPSNVTQITIFDGNSGEHIEITDKTDIHRIVKNLNEVTFQKGKPSFGYAGYRFKTTILTKGNTRLKLTINSKDTVRYKGFFYNAVDHNLDYDYIEQLVRSKNRMED